MALPETSPINEVYLSVFNPVLGTPAGAKTTIPTLVKGRIVKCGFVPNSVVTTAMTLAVLTDDHATTGSNFTNIVTSTIGTFSSTLLFEGANAAVVPASQAYVTEGGSIQFVTSGGQSSTVGGTVFAIIRKA